MKPVRVHSQTGRPLASLAWRTEDVSERMRGFWGRAEIGRGEGLWIAPCSAVHTFGMQVALDVVFLDEEGRVLKVVNALKPGRLAAVPLRRWLRPWRNQALELLLGGAHNLALGERLTAEDR